MNTPPPGAPSSLVFFSPESSSVAQEQDDIAEQIAALPSTLVTKQVPLSDDEKSLLQKTLDKYQVTPSQAIDHPLAYVGMMDGCLTALSKATWVPVPFTPWSLPLLPLLSLRYLGVAKTVGLYTAIGVGGGFCGRANAASEIYQKKPENRLQETRKRLDDDYYMYTDKMLEARLKRLKAETTWNQLVPRFNIRAKEKVLIEIKDALNFCTEMTIPPVTGFYEAELQKQELAVQKLIEESELFKQRMDKGEDVKLEWLRTSLNLDVESVALARVKELLESAKATPVQDVAGHLENLNKAAFGVSKDSKFQAAVEAYNQFLEASGQFDEFQAKAIRNRMGIIEILVDEQRVQLARDQGMTTAKEDKDASRHGVSGIADSLPQTIPPGESRST